MRCQINVLPLHPQTSNGALDEWLSQRSAKPSTAVRIRQAPHKKELNNHSTLFYLLSPVNNKISGNLKDKICLNLVFVFIFSNLPTPNMRGLRLSSSQSYIRYINQTINNRINSKAGWRMYLQFAGNVTSMRNDCIDRYEQMFCNFFI